MTTNYLNGGKLVKRIGTGLFLLALTALPAVAQTSVHSQVNVAGSFNSFETLNSNMVLVANNLWQADLTITNRSFFFKFATPNFAQNWGVNGQPHSTLPLALTGISGAGDIQITNVMHTLTNGVMNVLYRFLFNDATREFSVFLINDQSTTNLIYNGGFEQATGFSSTRAYYWDQNNPNLHGSMAGTAERQDWNLGNNTSTWVGLMKARWANQGNSGTWWQEAPVEPGVTYEAAAWFQPEGTPNLWTAAVQQLKLEYFDFSRTNLLATFTRDLSTIPPVPNLSDTNIAGNIWAQQFISGASPVGAAWARVVIFVDGIGPNGTFRIDDVSLRAASPKRTEDFNDWTGATIDNAYTRGGWSVVTGRTVVAYTNGSTVIPLSRSGFAASLSNPNASNMGSFIKSPRFDDGVGTITFYYRHGYQGDPTNSPEAPVHFIVQRSQLGDFWTTIAEVSNVINTSFQRYDVFNANTDARYMRIVHAGGSTNRLIIDDIFVDSANAQPRLMTFNSWTNATTSSNHFHLGWRLSNGLVSAAFALDGLAGQISGSSSSNHVLLSPTFNNGYGAISFNYRIGNSSTRSAGLSLEASTNGSTWSVLDTITNISSGSWQTYNQFFIKTTPHQIRIRNLPETNTASGIATSINENFPNAPTPPPGWTFTQIGAYTGSGNPAPALRMDATGANVVTPALINPTQLVFWVQGQSAVPENYFTVEGVIDGVWQTLMLRTNIPGSGTNFTIPLTSSVAQLRFTYYKIGAGNLALDNIRVTGTGGSAGPQSLVLENVDIGNPVEYRNQNFNSWPSKPIANSGDIFHQGWTLDGSVIIGPIKAFSGQAATLAVSSGGSTGSSSDYLVNFEGPGETKTSYASNNVSLNGIFWSLSDALIGTSVSDWKNGLRSARLRGYGSSIMQMIQDRPGGLSNVRFNYNRYGTDAQTAWRVQYSTNSGVAWTQIGTNFTASATVQIFNQTLNVNGNVRIRIIPTNTTGTADRRLNIDDIVLTENTGGGGGTTNNPSSITSHFMPEGIGPISFYYRHGGDSTAVGPSIMTALIQVSSNGTTWTTTSTVSIANTNYLLHEHYVSLTNHYYARIIVTNGTGTAIFDEIVIDRPQPPANATVIGHYEPILPYTNDTVTLFANITPLYGARNFSVTSYYRVGTSGIFNSIGMQPNGSVYQATSAIPRQARGTIVQFYIAAWYDGPGNQLTEPATYPADAPPHGTNYAFYAIPRNPPGRVWINEVDYNASVFDEFDFDIYSQEEFVELAGYAASDISGWRIDLIKGSLTGNMVFASYNITNTFVIANETNGFGFYVFAQKDIASPPRDRLMTETNELNFMYNNSPGGVRLYNELGGLEDELAYGGPLQGISFVGANDVDFTGFESTSSVSLVGIGSTSSDFDWAGEYGNKTPGRANSNQTFAVSPVIAVNTNTITFNYIPGSLDPNKQILIVSNAGGSALSYAITPNVSWLSVNPAVKTNLAMGASQIHTVQVSTVSLDGNYFGTLSIDGVAANSPVIIDVNLLESSLDDALVYYNFDEGAGSTVINSGTAGTNAIATIINGGRTLEAQGASASLNDFAYDSLVRTARVQTAIAVTNLNSLTRYTLTGWLRPNASSTGGVHRIIGNRHSNRGFDLYTTANYSNLSFVSSTGTSPAAVVSTNGSFPKEQWTFFAVTIDTPSSTSNNAIRFYRGTDISSIYLQSTHSTGALAVSSVSTGSLFVGGTGTNAFTGWMDDVRIYGSALDPMSIEAVRREGALRLTGEGEPPVIDAQPEDQIVALNTPAQFFVDASGVPTPQYQWRRNGTTMTGETAAILFIPNVTLLNTGVYDVIVYNAYGSVTSVTVTLTAGGGMSFVYPLTSLTAYEGETVTFNGTATSFTAVSYQWSKFSTNISLATNSLLILTNIQFASEGSYRVVASDGVESITSSVATLTVVPVEFDGDIVGGAIATPLTGVGIVLRWPSISNRLYDVLWSTNLLAGTQGFTPMVTNLPATPTVNIYTDTVHTLNLNGFYRIRVNQP